MRMKGMKTFGPKRQQLTHSHTHRTARVSLHIHTHQHQRPHYTWINIAHQLMCTYISLLLPARRHLCATAATASVWTKSGPPTEPNPQNVSHHRTSVTINPCQPEPGASPASPHHSASASINGARTHDPRHPPRPDRRPTQPTPLTPPQTNPHTPPHRTSPELRARTSIPTPPQCDTLCPAGSPIQCSCWYVHVHTIYVECDCAVYAEHTISVCGCSVPECLPQRRWRRR